MAAKVIERFWSAVRGGFVGLVGRRTDGSEDGVTVAVGDDGDIHPFLGAGEDLARARQLVEQRTVQCNQGIRSTSGTLHNTSGRVARLRFSANADGPVSVQLLDGGAGGATMTPTFWVPSSDSRVLEIDQSFTTDVYAAIGGTGVAAVDCTLHTSTVL